jgi:hypothetical protein
MKSNREMEEDKRTVLVGRPSRPESLASKNDVFLNYRYDVNEFIC